jgi:hypothetical protein
LLREAVFEVFVLERRLAMGAQIIAECERPGF